MGLLLDVTFAFPSGYIELRMAALKQCQAIDPADYQSGLFFNPDGYRSYYVRSECFQKTAVQFRDEALCAEVRQRVSLLSSSWGYSRTRCRELVAQGVAADRKTLEEIKRLYSKGAVTCVTSASKGTATVVTLISFPLSPAITRMATFLTLTLSRWIPAKYRCFYTPPAIMWMEIVTYEFS